MIIRYRLPELGEGIETADVVGVFVSPGDEVAEEQPLMEIETDKAAVEIPAPVVGMVEEVLIKEGDKINVGQLLITIKHKGLKNENVKSKEAGQEVVHPESKTLQRASGRKFEEYRAEDIEISTTQETVTVEDETAFTKESKTDFPSLIPASPSVRRLAREAGLDLNFIKGSGAGGRILIDDINKYLDGRKTGEKPTIKKTPTAPIVSQMATNPNELPDFNKWGRIEKVAMSNVRRLTAERVTKAWTVPHVTQYDKADITELDKLRKRYAENDNKASNKLTVTSIILKFVASALKMFPKFNASVDVDNGEIVYKKYYNVGVAVDTDRGLMVPVIKDVDKKNISQIAVELINLSERARSKKISVEELQGGTFTVSNLGSIGGTYFSPLVNAPEVAILGISRSSVEPVYVEGEFTPRLMLPLSLSYDHRLIDGADAIRFLSWIVKALEDPFKVSLEG